MHQFQAQAMEAATLFRLGRVFRAWRLEAFGIWLTVGFFYVTVPAIADSQPEVWPDTDDGF